MAWRAVVHEIAWRAVLRGGGDHADLEWLPGVVEARLAHRVDLLERAGATSAELTAAGEDTVAWAAELVGEQHPRKRGLNRSAWPVRLR